MVIYFIHFQFYIKCLFCSACGSRFSLRMCDYFAPYSAGVSSSSSLAVNTLMMNEV